MVSWTRKRERDAYENLLSKNKFQSLKFSNYLLIDAYPTDKVMARDGTLVIRSDSGKNIENFFKRNFIIDLF
jgi:hypothetical protein